MSHVISKGSDANVELQKNAQTPLSVLYDDKSVLEQMHYSLMLQVMRRTGLSVLLDGESGTSGCKKLLNAIILATDLGVHDQFMQSFEDLISNGVSATDPFKAKVLACQALIKCADISNPVCHPLFLFPLMLTCLDLAVISGSTIHRITALGCSAFLRMVVPSYSGKTPAPTPERISICKRTRRSERSSILHRKVCRPIVQACGPRYSS